MRPRRATIFLAALGLLVLAGCTANVAPSPFARLGGLSRALRLTITWPPRSRAANAPSAALSAVATLTGAGSGGGDVSFTVDRGVGVEGGVQTYDREIQTRNGEYDLTITYYANPGGEGTPNNPQVGEATARVRVIPDDQGIADITPGGAENPGIELGFDSDIVSIEVEANVVVAVGEARELGLAARDANGASVNITRGSAIFRAQAGSEGVLRVQPDGTVTGVSPGSVSVTATVNGITSLPVIVTVGSPDLTLSVTSVEVTPNQSVPVGQTRQLTFTARDANANPVSVTPGSTTFRVEPGSESRLSVTPDGRATGLSPGPAVVTAVVNGVASAPATVTVTSGTGSIAVGIQ